MLCLLNAYIISNILVINLHFILLSQQPYKKVLFDVCFTDNVTKSELLLESPRFIQIATAPGSNFRRPVINQHVCFYNKVNMVKVTNE